MLHTDRHSIVRYNVLANWSRTLIFVLSVDTDRRVIVHAPDIHGDASDLGRFSFWQDHWSVEDRIVPIQAVSTFKKLPIEYQNCSLLSLSTTTTWNPLSKHAMATRLNNMPRPVGNTVRYIRAGARLLKRTVTRKGRRVEIRWGDYEFLN